MNRNPHGVTVTLETLKKAIQTPVHVQYWHLHGWQQVEPARSPDRRLNVPVLLSMQATPTKVDGQPAGASCFSVALASPLPAGEVAALTVTAVLGTAQTAYPAEISQVEGQLMVYTDNLYVVSPYQVSTQITEVR